MQEDVITAENVAIAIALFSLIFNIGLYAATVKNTTRELTEIRLEMTKLREIVTMTAVLNNRIATVENRMESNDIRMNNTSNRIHALTRDVFRLLIATNTVELKDD